MAPRHSRSLLAKAFLFFILILSTTATWVFSTATAKSVTLPPLRFKNTNGQFKILQVADMHYADGQSTKCLDVFPSHVSTCSDLNTTAFVKRMIKAEQPDLIVFTGVKGWVNQSMQTKRFPLILDDVWEEPAKLLEKLRVLGFNSYNQTTLLDVRQSRDIHNKNRGFDRR